MDKQCSCHALASAKLRWSGRRLLRGTRAVLSDGVRPDEAMPTIRAPIERQTEFPDQRQSEHTPPVRAKDGAALTRWTAPQPITRNELAEGKHWKPSRLQVHAPGGHMDHLLGNAHRHPMSTKRATCNYAASGGGLPAKGRLRPRRGGLRAKVSQPNRPVPRRVCGLQTTLSTRRSRSSWRAVSFRPRRTFIGHEPS